MGSKTFLGLECNSRGFPEWWIGIKGYGGRYLVSSHGKVESIPLHQHKLGTCRIMEQHGWSVGQYQRVSLYYNDEKYTKVVHRLVLEAFRGLCPDGWKAKHTNGDRYDNCADNLKWVPTREAQRAIDRDRRLARVLTPAQVLRVREIHKAGLRTIKQMAKMFDVTQNTIIEAIRSEWKELREHSTD